MVKNRLIGALAVAVGVGLTGACNNLLDVSDPQNFTDEDLDNALAAVARGVEGSFHSQMDEIGYRTALLGDEWQHTGTWSGWDDLDHGRIRYATSSADGSFAGLMRARFSSQDARARFERVLDNPNGDPLMAVVLVVEAMIDLVVAENFCEAPADQAGQPITDTEMYQQALTKLQAAQAVAQSAGSPNSNDYAMIAQAGIARAQLMLGDYPAAAAAAAQVPTSFTYEALFSLNSANNGIVNLATQGFNNAGGMREKWWASVDTDADLMMDPWTGELDSRLPVLFNDGVVGVDGITPHYSQWKYRDVGDDMEIIGGREMRLIEAEVEWRNGNLQPAIDILNTLRADVGLSALTPPGAAWTSQEVQDRLLSERFAENFMEGHRLNDLNRFGLIPAMMTAGDFDSPTTGVNTNAERAVKFPLDDGEAINNPNIQDLISARCTPTVTAN